MTEYTSEIRIIPYAASTIFRVLADLRNLEKLKDKIPQDKIQDITCDKDSCTLSINPIGKIKFIIEERVPDSTIIFIAQQVPFPVQLSIELFPNGEKDTQMQLTVKAEINAFLKPMVSKPLQQGIEKMAEMLTTIPYDAISEV